MEHRGRFFCAIFARWQFILIFIVFVAILLLVVFPRENKNSWPSAEKMRLSRVWSAGTGSGSMSGFYTLDNKKLAGIAPFDTSGGYLTDVGGYFPAQCSLFKVLENYDSWFIQKLFGYDGYVLFDSNPVDAFSCPLDLSEDPLLIGSRYGLGGSMKNGVYHSLNVRLEAVAGHHNILIEESVGPYDDEKIISLFKFPINYSKDKVHLRIGSARYVVSGLQRTKRGVTTVAFIKPVRAD